MYADNIVSPPCQQNVWFLKHYKTTIKSQKVGLQINFERTQVMYSDFIKCKKEININSQKTEKVRKFTYLGQIKHQVIASKKKQIDGSNSNRLPFPN